VGVKGLYFELEMMDMQLSFHIGARLGDNTHLRYPSRPGEGVTNKITSMDKFQLLFIYPSAATATFFLHHAIPQSFSNARRFGFVLAHGLLFIYVLGLS
jgi:hypothetical protein